MLGFIIKVAGYAWKYGTKAIKAVTAWIKNNWSTVKKWLDRGLSVTTIIELILKSLGL